MRLGKKTRKRQQASIIYSPFDLSDAVPAPGRRRFWKQILPVTSITYKGQRVDFNPRFHMDLADSFGKSAFDQVPVVFANADNAHNMDPRNFGGDVLKMEYRGPGKNEGTWALIEADKKAAKAIEANPRLGVSARIRQGVEKADGRFFRRAIEHVCLTMNPRVTGMGPWQAVDLSEDDADIEVVDLTAVPYTEGKSMRKTRKVASTKRRTSKGGETRTIEGSINLADIDLSEISDETFQTLLDLSATATEDETEVEDDEKGKKDKARKTKRKKSRTKITVEKDSESDDDDLDDNDDLDADLTDEDEEIETAEERRARRGKSADRIERMALNLAEDRWDKQKESYLRDGVPAFLLDLAEPVLTLPDNLVIDLSDEGVDEEIDATGIIKKMLDGVRGTVDLSDEMGHASADVLKIEDKDADEFDAAWDRDYPIS